MIKPHHSCDKVPFLLVVLLACTTTLCLLPHKADASDNALWLSPAPGAANTGSSNCGHVAAGETAENKRPPAAVEKTVPGAPPQGARYGKGRKPSRFESEHRPQLRKTYYLNRADITAEAKAYVQHPDGSVEAIPIHHDKGVYVSIELPFKQSDFHGANRVFLVDRQVVDTTLEIRIAQWLTIHHSCGWGHDFRNDRSRQVLYSLPEIPLDIIAGGLWDTNFHASTRSGDRLPIQILSYGRPLADSLITVTTEKDWQRRVTTDSSGRTEVQLIRDYYPGLWRQFKRTQLGELKIQADYKIAEQGEFMGKPYSEIHYVATFPWKYTPGQSDYSSYASGLFITLIFLGGGGFGVYAYRRRRSIKAYKGVMFDE